MLCVPPVSAMKTGVVYLKFSHTHDYVLHVRSYNHFVYMIALELQPSSVVISQALKHVAFTQLCNAEGVDVSAS